MVKQEQANKNKEHAEEKNNLIRDCNRLEKENKGMREQIKHMIEDKAMRDVTIQKL